MPGAKVVCPCVAKKHKLKISGRKNMLGSISGRRRCPWFSGCNSLLAVLLRSNTNFMPNYRVPLSEKTVEPDCTCLRKNTTENVQEHVKKLCQITQRALRQMTGYFAGYISKRQKMGKLELKAASSSLPFLLQKMKAASKAAHQLAMVTNRLLVTLEGKGMLRTATESFNLCGNSVKKDELRPEFIRTFRHVTFAGWAYLETLEQLLNKPDHVRAQPMTVPKARSLRSEVEVRGYPLTRLFQKTPGMGQGCFCCPSLSFSFCLSLSFSV